MDPNSHTRGLATILAADVADLSRRMEADDTVTVARLLRLRRWFVASLTRFKCLASADELCRVFRTVLTGLLLYCLLPGSPAGAQDADPALMAEGLRVYKTKAECDECHGWTGRGGQYDDDPNYLPGPSLVLSTLGRDTMIELVSCGTPGGDMPRYLADAWT